MKGNKDSSVLLYHLRKWPNEEQTSHYFAVLTSAILKGIAWIYSLNQIAGPAPPTGTLEYSRKNTRIFPCASLKTQTVQK